LESGRKVSRKSAAQSARSACRASPPGAGGLVDNGAVAAERGGYDAPGDDGRGGEEIHPREALPEPTTGASDSAFSYIVTTGVR
jgi:hypothetical protein